MAVKLIASDLDGTLLRNDKSISEETGKVSVAFGGELIHDIDADSLKNKLEYIRRKNIDVKSFRIWRGRLKHEREDI